MKMSVIKSIFSNIWVQCGMLAVVIIAGTIINNSLRSKINYIDCSCPICSSHDILDFGWDETMNGHQGHCSDCGCDFYTTEKNF